MTRTRSSKARAYACLWRGAPFAAAALAASLVAAAAAESPWGGPIRPPSPENEPSRALVAPPPMCVVEANTCVVPAGMASGSACACEIDGVVKTGVVRRVKGPAQSK
jgi:hypothetical protein